MKRVLIVYPEGDSPHAIRIVRPLAQYLPRHGWKPTLLTTPGQGTHLPLERIEVAAGGFALTPHAPSPHDEHSSTGQRTRSLRSMVGRHLAVPDRYTWWAVQAVRAARRLSGFDGVITSGPPHSAHTVGAAYRGRYAVPWIADMRDPWSTNHYTIYSRLTRVIDERIEKLSLKHASAIVTVSDSLARGVSAVHARPVETISNSFDPTEFADFPPATFKPLTICYAGSLIGGRRSPDLLLRAVATVRERSPHLQIRALFMTDRPDLVREAAARERVSDVVDSQGWTSRHEVLAAWKSASVLVLLRWEDPRDEGVPTGKLFEYLGAGRPVLSLGGAAGVVGKILCSSGSGTHCGTAEDAALFLEHVAERRAPLRPDVSAYSAATMATRFAELLDRG